MCFCRKKECGICFEKKHLIKINCNHKFCKSCLNKLIGVSNIVKCSYCRRKVTFIKNKQLYYSLALNILTRNVESVNVVQNNN